MNTWPRRALFAAGFSLTVTSAAFAALSDVDPGPYTFATGGYPMWYKDANDLSLELCQSRAPSTPAPGGPRAPADKWTPLPPPGNGHQQQPHQPHEQPSHAQMGPGRRPYWVLIMLRCELGRGRDL